MSFFQKQNLSLGQRGEKAAANYLKKQGYEILATNFCNIKGKRMGEIDIIAKHDQEIVFVEVKTREKKSYQQDPPETNINRAKLHKLNKIASFYLSSQKMFSQAYRFDAISIICQSTENKAEIRHLKNIFFLDNFYFFC